MYFFCCSAQSVEFLPIIEPNEMIQVILETTTLKSQRQKELSITGFISINKLQIISNAKINYTY